MNALEQQARQFQELLKNLPTGAFIYDVSQQRIHVNRAFNNLLPARFTDCETLDTEQLTQRLSTAFAGQRLFRKTVKHFLKSGEDITGWAMQTTTGALLSIDFRFFSMDQPLILCIMKDVTAVKQAIDQIKVQEEKYRVVLENMNLGILEVDNRGIIRDVFDKFCEMTGYARRELIGHTTRELLLVEGDETILEEEKKRLQGISSSYEARIRKKDGSLIWVMISGTPIYDREGKVSGSFGIHMDITRLKETERALIDESSKALQAFKWKEDLMAKMSHEMRTPINDIMGLTNLLIESSEMPAKQRHNVQTIKRSANNLLLLIEDLLDYAVMERGSIKLQQQPFSLFEVMDGVYHHFRDTAGEKDLQILFEYDDQIPDTLQGDPAKIGQALKQLLSNAIKFSRQSTIHFEARHLANKNGRAELLLSVADHGIGIPAVELKNILQGFYQIEQTQTVNKGVGIGLSMVKLIADKMNGKLNITSEEGHGTTVRLYLTLPASSPQPASHPGKSPEEIRILVAEDNVINQMLLKENLKRWKFNYDVVDDGQKALNLLRANHYDLVLMDIQMPVLGGLEATKLIRTELPEEKRNIPILALTAYSLEEKRNKCLEAGMNDYISKPFNPTQLFYKIAGLIPVKTESNPGSAGTKAMDPLTAETDPEILDPREISRFTRGNLEIQQRLINRFLTDAPGDLKRINQLCDEEKWEELFELVHRLKPTISMMGLKRAEKLANQLHEQMKDLQPPTSPDTIHHFSEAVKEALPELRTFLNQ